MNRVIINTHRAGDILNNLPIAKAWADQGDTVYYCVHSRFEDIVAATSYAIPLVFKGDQSDSRDAERLARLKAPKDAEFIHLQPTPSPKSGTIGCHRFSVEPWLKAGMVDRFHTDPLVLDRRITSRDALTIDRYWPKDGRPTLLLCLSGHSSNPLKCGWSKTDLADFQAWVQFEANKLGWNVLDITALKLPSILDLVPLLSRAVALLSADTGVIHLAYATQTPTVVMSVSHEWSKSEPRKHWLGQLTYRESRTPSGRDRIMAWLNQPRPYTLGTMARPVKNMLCRPMVHVYPETESERQSDALARGSWGMMNWGAWRFFPIRSGDGFKAMVSEAIRGLKPDDMVCLTDLSTALTSEAAKVADEFMQTTDACFSPVIELDKVSVMHTRDSLMGQAGGASAYFFTANWWKGYQDQISERQMTEPDWDQELKRIMLAYNPSAELVPPVAYREVGETQTVEAVAISSTPASGSIVQVVHDYGATGEDKRRDDAAQKTWKDARDKDKDWILIGHEIDGGRSSRDVGDSRKLPYIHDLFDFAAQWAQDEDILLLCNADIHLCPNAGEQIRQAIGKADCAYCWRITLPKGKLTLNTRELSRVRTDFGIDLFACRKSWWLSIREDYPDFFLGCTGWDVVMRKLMDARSPHARIPVPIYCHEEHESFWKVHKTNPGQAHNQRLWDEWEESQCRTLIAH